MKISILLILCLLAISFARNEHLILGDNYYSKRAEDSKDNRANPKNAKGAIDNYTLALEDPAAKEEAAWKLLRTYYFFGRFAISSSKDRKVFFDKARKEGKDFFKEFPKNNEIAYWYSVCLAQWAREVNPLVALNAGAPNETRDIAQKLIDAEKYGDIKSAARGCQILGHSHQAIPKISFILNWVNKDSAEFYLAKSMRLNQEDLTTRLFLAEYYKNKKDMDKAKALLLPALKNKPRPEEYLEDERNFIKMRKLLE